MATPTRIQRQRTKGWRAPEGSVYVGRPSRWGNPFKFGTKSALMRVPGVLDPTAEAEYEGRISAAGMRHDYFHPDGRVTECTVRYMTAEECVEYFRRVLVGDLTPAMVSSGFRAGQGVYVGRGRRVTVDNVRADLAGRDLSCWCPLDQPCHADVLLDLANRPRCPHHNDFGICCPRPRLDGA